MALAGVRVGCRPCRCSMTDLAATAAIARAALRLAEEVARVSRRRRFEVYGVRRPARDRPATTSPS